MILQPKDILKALFALLCFEGGAMTVTKEVIGNVPDGWPEMLEIDQPGVGLIRLRIKPEAKKHVENKILLN